MFQLHCKGKSKSNRQRGQGLIEYLLIVCLVAVGAMAVMRGLGQTVAAKFATVTNILQGSSKKPVVDRVDPSAYQKKDMSNFFHGAVLSSSSSRNGASGAAAKQKN